MEPAKEVLYGEISLGTSIVHVGSEPMSQRKELGLAASLGSESMLVVSEDIVFTKVLR